MQSRRDTLKQLLGTTISNLFDVGNVVAGGAEKISQISSETLFSNFRDGIYMLFQCLEAVDRVLEETPHFMNTKSLTELDPLEVHTITQVARGRATELLFNDFASERQGLANIKLNRAQAKDFFDKSFNAPFFKQFSDDEISIMHNRLKHLLSLSKADYFAYTEAIRQQFIQMQSAALKFCELNGIEHRSSFCTSDPPTKIKHHLNLYSFPDNASAAKVLRGAALPENTFVIINDKKHSNEPPKNWADKITESRDVECSSCERVV